MYISDIERSEAARAATRAGARHGDRVVYEGPELPRRAGPSLPVKFGTLGTVDDATGGVDMNGHMMVGVRLDFAPSYAVYLPLEHLAVIG